MIANLGHGMKRKLLQLFNTSWKTGRIPQAWKVAYRSPRLFTNTEDQITLISQSIEDGFQEKKSTVAVWVDMEKAFDRVWKKGLSYKLQKYGVIGKMHQWITEYLRDRKARVKIQDHTSRCHALKEEVPQGSILSPTLFSIYISTTYRKSYQKESMQLFMLMI